MITRWRFQVHGFKQIRLIYAGFWIPREFLPALFSISLDRCERQVPCLPGYRIPRIFRVGISG